MTGELDGMTEAAFVAELEVFQNEVEAATQFFHAERFLKTASGVPEPSALN